MLKQRVVTALAMAALFLAGVFYLPLPTLAAVFALVVVAGAWEWSSLAGLRGPLAAFLYALLVLAACAFCYVWLQLGSEPKRVDVQPVLGAACLWWCFALLWVKSYPASAPLWNSRLARLAMGLLVLVPAWVAAVYLLSFTYGGALVVGMVLFVAAADIGAYFAGKRFGRHRLAAQVSPAKTWEGFWGGVACCSAVALLIWWSLPARFDHLGPAVVIAVALSTGLTSVLGDLTVSMVKRESGVKDSSSLLPGHGGLLDRLDSLCGAAPTYALGLLLAGY